MAKKKVKPDIQQLKEGDIIDLDISDRVYADVPMSVESPAEPVCWDLVEAEINIGWYGYLPGPYVVYQTLDEHTSATDFGYHVWCENAKYPYIKVHFYQGAGFYLSIDYKKVIKRAVRRWVVDKGS